jgi:phage terminase large subunit GpA-like protein
VRNEALDTEVYALHAARKLRVNLMTEAAWSAIESRLRQPGLLPGATEIPRETPAPEPVTTGPIERPAVVEAPARRSRVGADAALLAQLTPGGMHGTPPSDGGGAPY